MDECDALGARRTRRSVHKLCFPLSPPRRNGWLIRQRINDVASRKPEPDSDGPVRVRETVSRQDRHSDGRARPRLQSRETMMREGLGRFGRTDR